MYVGRHLVLCSGQVNEVAAKGVGGAETGLHFPHAFCINVQVVGASM